MKITYYEFRGFVTETASPSKMRRRRYSDTNYCTDDFVTDAAFLAFIKNLQHCISDMTVAGVDHSFTDVQYAENLLKLPERVIEISYQGQRVIYMNAKEIRG